MTELRSGAAVFRTGTDNRILDWTPACERLTGIDAADAVGRPCWEVMAGRAADGGIVCHPGCSTARLAKEGWPARCEVHMRTPFGLRQIAASIIVLQDESHRTILHVLREASEPVVVPPINGRPPRLTHRQREILSLLVEGVRAKQIASRLGLSETTVRNHIRAILRELGVHSQLEAVARARELSLALKEPAA